MLRLGLGRRDVAQGKTVPRPCLGDGSNLAAVRPA
jgi:hypothetical protein